MRPDEWSPRPSGSPWAELQRRCALRVRGLPKLVQTGFPPDFRATTQTAGEERMEGILGGHRKMS